MTAPTTTAYATQRNRWLAHTMNRRRTPLPVICSLLEVDERSVQRYLEQPCPDKPEEPLTLEFRHEGICRQRPDVEWFPENFAQGLAAKRVCLQCPVMAKCRDYALANADVSGIWGGTTDSERRRIRKQIREDEAAESSRRAAGVGIDTDDDQEEVA
ncbi:transcription factor WhiB [Mycobacteroides abscessus subsp. abscessus]|uniref:WhiB family transcriptional regulator n=1 Tax=Mycobacteroides abscessus TaxID=36809 RepID=UPI0009271552|nr:WhiB family transcriptional regulator [Mycobacteroides abscessus]SIJ20807.1 transcription factor WhiB [Mycobacteroides abscessus subsp. abscessus]SLH39520.1 transcription factor WhiB [Mycobacteroides abscessus subsp. abscessus]